MDFTEDEWEFYNDEGFVYKRKKRRADDPRTSTAQGPDPEIERRRRERKRNALLKIKEQYQKEIDQWDNLSNTLRALQQKTQTTRIQGLQETTSIPDSSSTVVQETEMGFGSVLDELLVQAEAQAEVIHDISNLCDVVEAICDAEEERLNQSIGDLPIWSSPRALMASLCDE